MQATARVYTPMVETTRTIRRLNKRKLYQLAVQSIGFGMCFYFGYQVVVLLAK